MNLEEELDKIYLLLSDKVEARDRIVAATSESEQKQKAREDIKYTYEFIESYINFFKDIAVKDPEACKEVIHKLRNLT
jgi:hypothetical protein